MASEASCWYFAYGSNMNVRRMEDRVRRRGIERKLGYIQDYKMVFNKLASESKGTGYANIIPQSGAIVYGVLYKLTEKEMKTLDKYERVDEGHYQRKKLEITVEENEQVTAYVYVALRTKEGLRPTQDYLKCIIEGAKENGLPQDYIQQLETLETVQAA
ncbi:MAG: gamma-glutamylcyclotransferase [Candidatus Bipolaricaulota bacterium]|nr:gamma-glutamylcyclotransferase [Candidatus Bipolaricaulota bacterium]MCS7274988.1 gamma-glutamylcyclotransferase [Candidatus Bipolaricaulota bacterium]MDW8110547.1 gamma-glutamylcyclotransferase family protein [Candidatus Bipolaricaulota bacterium]MDW8329302.1 gamma-glutamylcyclotransferase family protein [Candidatus Bipolaricaulota bacterium]